MDWGWIVLIAIVALLVLPLFVPLIVRVRAEPGVLEWSLALGHITFLPDIGERSSRWKRQWGKVGRIVGWPFVMVFRLLALLFRAITWPLRAMKRRRPSRRREAGPVPDATPDVPLPEPDRGEPDERGEESSSAFDDDLSRTGHTIDPAPPDSTLAPDAPDEVIPRQTSVDVAGDADPPPASAPEEGAVPPRPDDMDGESAARTDDNKDDADPDTAGGEIPSDHDTPASDSSGSFTPSSSPPPPLEPPPSADDDGDEGSDRPGGRLADLFARIEMIREAIERYGRIATRLLRAVLLFLVDCTRALDWRRLDLQWSTGGDPASLGQLLGWHHALTASVDPRLAGHVQFSPRWESEEVMPSGHAHIHLYIWGYRFVPPVLRLIGRIPWWSLLRLAYTFMKTRKRTSSQGDRHGKPGPETN